jgi:hypothetical protein
MLTTDVYTIKVELGTRNHKGCFVQDKTYKLIGIDQASWALICQDNTTCHYVDPDCLREMPNLLDD